MHSLVAFYCRLFQLLSQLIDGKLKSLLEMDSVNHADPCISKVY